jgi:uncharacterized membrane protein
VTEITNAALAGPSTRLWYAWRPVAVAIVLFVVAAALARGGLLTSDHPGDVGHYSSFAHRVRDGLFPYGAGFYFEYPPFALPAFVLPQLIAPDHYLGVFKVLMAFCAIGTIAATAALLSILQVRDRQKTLLLVPVAIAPLLLGSTYLNRYDPFAALLTSLALLAFASGRMRTGGVVLAFAFAAKTYPAAIVPIAAIWAYRSGGRKRLLDASLAFVCTSVVVYAPFALRAFGGLGNSYYTQARRSLQIESLGASALLIADKLGVYSVHWFRGMSVDLAGGTANAVATVTSLLLVAAVLAIAWLYYRSGRSDVRAFLVASAAAVFAFVAFNKVSSPQFMVWLVPLVPLAPISVAAAGSVLISAILIATNIDTVWGDWGLRNGDWTVWVVSARNLGILALLVLFARQLRTRVQDPA